MYSLSERCPYLCILTYIIYTGVMGNTCVQRLPHEADDDRLSTGYIDTIPLP